MRQGINIVFSVQLSRSEVTRRRGNRTERRVDIEEVLAVDVVVGEMSKVDFIEGHRGRVVNQVVAREEGQEDDRDEDRPAPLGELGRLRLREGLVEVEHVVLRLRIGFLCGSRSSRSASDR